MASPYAEEFSMLGFGLFIIFIRIGSRIGAVGVRKLYADDYLMVLAAVSHM